MLGAMIDAIKNPADLGLAGRRDGEAAYIMKMLVVEESPKHFHVGLKLSKECTFAPFKVRLRERSGFASHWSCSHTMLWSVVRYLTTVTEKKPEVDPKPFAWTPADRNSGEAFNVYEESQEPYCAIACRKRREKAEMTRHMTPQSATSAKKTKSEAGPHRFNKGDFNDMVLAKKLKTPAQVMSHLHARGSQETRAWVQKNQRRLKEYIEDADDWAQAPARARKEQLTDWEILCAAAEAECEHGASCPYATAASKFFKAHKSSFSPARLAVAIRGIIINGPSKEWRVPFLIGKTNTGKSTIVESVEEVYGQENIFELPAETDDNGGALRDWTKPEIRFVFWDEFKPVVFIEKGVIAHSQFLKASTAISSRSK